MSEGEGKGWAKGHTAANDTRIANAAAAHRGKTYARHLVPEQDRRRHGQTARSLTLEWSDTMAYVVGLIATDGCLISDGRHLNFKSEDQQLVETFLECLGRPLSLVSHAKRRDGGKTHFYAQFSDVELYRWLEGIGLMPRKSLVLGALDVPQEHLLPCVRGLLDGDGSLVNNLYAGGGKAAGRMYEGFTTRFISASREHVVWLRTQLHALLGVRGWLTAPSRPRECWSTSYGIRESCALLPRIYPHDRVPKLERKWEIWRRYAERHDYPATLEAFGDARAITLPDPRDARGRYQGLWSRGRSLREAV